MAWPKSSDPTKGWAFRLPGSVSDMLEDLAADEDVKPRVLGQRWLAEKIKREHRKRFGGVAK